MNNNNMTKNKVISSLVWKLLERGGTHGVQLIIQIVLARLLSPEEFGTIAIVLVFINLGQVFVQSGFNTSLIQKKNATEVDFSSVFYLSLAVAVVLYIVIFLTAPNIAVFYEKENLTLILRVLSISLIFGAFNSIQNAIVSRELKFKILFKSSLGAAIISGTVGILAAYQGMGVWSLVLQQILNQFSVIVIMWFTVRWRPIFVFSVSSVKELFSYGWKLLASSLLNTLYLDLRTLIIGRIYTPSILGFYNRGEQFPKIIVSNLNGSIQSVMLPTLSVHQDSVTDVRRLVRRSIKTSSFVVFPMMAGMAIIAEPLIIIVLGEQWLPSVPYLQIFCAVYSFMPIHTANLQAINAVGRSDIFLKLEVMKKTLGVLILVITVPLGVYAIAFGQILSSIISSFINAYPNRKLLDYNYKEQISDITPQLLITLAMGIPVYFVSLLQFSPVLTLTVQVITGIILYLFLAMVFKLESYNYLTITLKQLFTKK